MGSFARFVSFRWLGEGFYFSKWREEGKLGNGNGGFNKSS